MFWVWAGFIGFVLLMLALDLGVFHREAHVVTLKEAFAWSAVWILMGLGFAVFVCFGYNQQWFRLACHMVKVVGEPYEGKPHVRFEAAGGGNQGGE